MRVPGPAAVVCPPSERNTSSNIAPLKVTSPAQSTPRGGRVARLVDLRERERHGDDRDRHVSRRRSTPSPNASVNTPPTSGAPARPRLPVYGRPQTPKGGSPRPGPRKRIREQRQRRGETSPLRPMPWTPRARHSARSAEGGQPRTRATYSEEHVPSPAQNNEASPLRGPRVEARGEQETRPRSERVGVDDPLEVSETRV